MNQEQIIDAFCTLGRDLKDLEFSESDTVIFKAIQSNNWFTLDSIQQASKSIAFMLEREKLVKWSSQYKFAASPKTIGVIMAGNIPMVGFHDLLSVLISGNRIKIKLSSKDQFLIPYLTNLIQELSPEFNELIEYVEQLRDFDAVIATGSDNSANYFNQYFSKYPNLIRKNRISCTVITGIEKNEELQEIGKDIFNYYGLGCRNVSKIYIPDNYDIKLLIDQLEPFSHIIDHHKYANNYDYNKSIYLVNKEPHLDNGFLLIRESEEMVSPISVVFVEKYGNLPQLKEMLLANNSKIQCTVTVSDDIPSSIKPGKSQTPEPWDYADNIDTMKFLATL